MLVGAQHVSVNADVKNVAFALFIFSLGYIAGPQFFANMNAKGLRFGLDGFGASAPAKDLYDHFGLTADKIVFEVLARLKELGFGEARRPEAGPAALAEAEAHPS